MTLVSNDGVPQFHVAVCIPCGDHVSASFAMDLAKLVQHTSTYDNVRLSLLMVKGTIITSARHMLACNAQKMGATHVLWLDADMRFPADTVARLLAHGKPIVASYYSTRRSPSLPTVSVNTATSMNDWLVLTEESKGLIEVSRCGMGVMLVDTGVFRSMGKPYFAIGYSPKGDGVYVGEDVWFCDKARKAGHQIFIDADLSKEVEHLGEYAYTWERPGLTLAAQVEEMATLRAAMDSGVMQDIQRSKEKVVDGVQ